MRVIYDIGIRIYQLAAGILSLWNPKARKWVWGRRGWRNDLKKAIRPGERVVWVHCASLGEFEQGRPVIEALRERIPGIRILLTFFSPSGYEKRKDYRGAGHVMYLPLDTVRNAKDFISLSRPEMVLFIKYEFWHHYLKELDKREIPVFLVSGIFRPDQLFFRWYGGWYRKFLFRFRHIFVQQASSLELLRNIGASHVSVAGDTRFDRVIQVAKSPAEHLALEQFRRNYRVIVAGSIWEADESLLDLAVKQGPATTGWILAPHEPSGPTLKRLQRRFDGAILLSGIDGDMPPSARVVIVDTMGQLSFLYRFGCMAYVGGGFGRGIHNILEAAVYGIPVMIGPNHRRFQEAEDLVREGGAFAVGNPEEFLSTIDQHLASADMLKTHGKVAGDYVKSRGGATYAIVDFLCKTLGC